MADQQTGTPKLTAIISLYNSSYWLINRLDNLYRTTLYRSGELAIVLVCANSPDANDRVIAEAATQNKNVRLLDTPTCTVYQAWNEAIKVTDTPFITNANADDIVAPDCYEKLIDACDQTGADFAYPNWYHMIAPNQKWPPFGAIKTIGQYNPKRRRTRSCGHFPVWRRTVHGRIGLFDPTLEALGDADLWYRAFRTGSTFYHHQSPLGGYLWRHGNNLWHRVSAEKKHAEWQKVLGRTQFKLP